jgi:ORF6N domain-containing protein
MPGSTRKLPGTLVAPDQVAQRILVIRGQRVMLDRDLAALYGVLTKALNQAVRRNRTRFPEDFMFQLTRDEVTALKSQFVTSSPEHGGHRYAPYAFTEQGVAMLSSVLRSTRAVAVNIEIMRAFVRLRQLLATHVELTQKLTELERKYDTKLRVVFDAIRQLMEPVDNSGRPEIGFR